MTKNIHAIAHKALNVLGSVPEQMLQANEFSGGGERGTLSPLANVFEKPFETLITPRQR